MEDIKVKDISDVDTGNNKKDEKETSLSYFSLFKYASNIEKFMIFIGIIGAIVQGLTMPAMIKVIGKLIELFVAFVATLAIKNATGLNDKQVKEFFDALGSPNPTQGLQDVAMKYKLNITDILSKFQDSDYGDLASSVGNEESHVDFSLFYKSSDDFWSDLRMYCYLFIAIGIISFVFTYLMDAFLTITSTRQTTRIRSLTFHSIMRQDVTWHEKTSPGELASRIISDTIIIEDGIGMKLGMLVQSVVTFIACFILAYTSGWKLALGMSIIIPILLIIVTVMGSILRKFTKKSQDAYAELGGIAQEAFSQIRTIVSFGTEQKEIDRYVSKLGPTRKYGIIRGNTLGFAIGLAFCVVYASFAIAFIFGTRLIRDGEMIYGDVLNVFMGIMMGSMTLSGVGNIMSNFGESIGAAVKLFDIIERKTELDLEIGDVPEKDVEGTIEFQDVCFNYPSRPNVEVLKGISFKCSPGQTVALVGASGSGKSTTIQLLERFYNKKSGRILIDGRDIEEYNVNWIRSQIGLVSQEPTLFDASVAENISINCPEATQEQIEAVSKLANAHEFIMKLTNGYNTSTGERGLQLSGGQKQRICIARALMKNPKILLLDEATSALDNQSEKVVQAALDAASSGRTTLVIAHRLTTVRNANLIIVLEKGVIIESGNHEELMMKKGHYYNLVKNQEIAVEEARKDENSESEEVDPDDIKQEIIEESEPLNKRETTILSRISTNLSIGRRRTTGALSEVSKKSMNKDDDKLVTMDWKRYLSINLPYWVPNVLGFIGSAFNGAIQPAFAFIFSSALNTFNKQGDELTDGGLFWGIMFIVLGFCNFIFFYCQLGGFSVAGEYLVYNLRKNMYNSMIRQEVAFFDTNDIGETSGPAGPGAPGGPGGASNTSTGTLTAKLATEAALVNGLNMNVGIIFQQVVTVLGGFGIAFAYGWKLALILLISVPFLFFGSYVKMKSIKNRSSENRKVFENSSKVACEAIVSIKTVMSLNLQQHFSEIYDEKLDEPTKRLERRAHWSGVGTGFSNGIAFFAYVLGFSFGSVFIENGELEFDSMFKVLMAIIFMAMAVGQSSSIIPDSQKSIEAFNHVMDILDRKPKIDASDPSGIKKDVPGEFKGEIKFDDIRFRYPSRPNVTVLRMGNKKIEIKPGQVCAFVGGSGCGKSTLIGLLPRWYDAQHGSVKVDEEDNKTYNVKWLREQIGIVNQEPCLFNISIKENIKYGKLDATDEEIYEAARKANIHDFIMSLPDKYDTLVGGLGTSQMSGGQKQRIAIARAMIRNPKVLLLDEATSALDAESELIVQKALEDASQGRTTITIAHRLSTIKDADLICVFKDGRIIEIGKHEELMENKGEYYNMVLAGEGSILKGNEIAKKNGY